MNTQKDKLYSPLLAFTILVIVTSACSSSTPTRAPKVSTATTDTPASAVSSILKPGHWANVVGTQGYTNVSFDLSDGGNISNFVMKATLLGKGCEIKVDRLQIKVEKNGAFVIAHFIEYADLEKQVGPAVMSIVPIPTGQPYEALHISGNTTDTSMDGTYKINLCGAAMYFDQNTGPWKAQWKNP